LINLVTKVGRELLHVEEGLLTALPVALRKAPESRGTFDHLCLQEMNKSVVAYQDRSQSALSERPAVLGTLENTVNTYEQQVSTAEQQLAELVSQLQTVEARIVEASAALKDVSTHLKQHPKNVEKAQKAQAAAEARVAAVKKALESLTMLIARKSLDEELPDLDITSDHDGAASNSNASSVSVALNDVNVILSQGAVEDSNGQQPFSPNDTPVPAVAASVTNADEAENAEKDQDDNDDNQSMASVTADDQDMDVAENADNANGGMIPVDYAVVPAAEDGWNLVNYN
jgi:hypothetical protein